MSAFTDFIALQADHAHILLSDPWLQDVNIITRDKLLLPQSLARLPDKTLAAEVLVYITPRAGGDGRKGCGVIVEVPEFSVLSPNVSGPQGDILCNFLVIEDPLANESPARGTLRPANQVAQRILDLLHHDAEDGTGTLRAEGRAIQEDRDWEPLRAFRVSLRLSSGRNQTVRCSPVTISVATGSATLTATPSGARIFYTLDESFPGPSNPAATEYTAAFAVEAGQIIRAGAYLADYNQGPRRRYTVT